MRPNDVAVGLMRIDRLAPGWRERAEARLDDQERARAARFRVPGARDQFVAARALLRHMLTQQGGARDWRFRAEPAGRLVLDASAPDFVFSLSHTRGLVACALARGGEVGVDVEAVAEADDLVALARRSFSAGEAARVVALDGAARADAFFAYWTLKEAYVKARGVGLSADTTAFSFELAEPIAIRFHSGFDDEAARWRFRRGTPTPTTRLALAAAAPLDLSDATPRWIEPQACA
jgi:4'-phosphopantetheinyl transferase